MTVFRQFFLVLVAGVLSSLGWAQTKSFDQFDITLSSACFNTPYDDFATRKFGDKLYVLSAAKNA
ncbi:MAG: hypothetical protein ACK48O_05575, partial [Flavobacteriia bacterium]